MQDTIEHKDRAYASIRRKLLEGRVRTRKDLSRRRLAEELGLSTISIRAAVERLEGEGLLDSRAQSGTYVRQLTVEECLHQYDLREMIESYAAGRAALWITAEQLERLEYSCDLFEGIAADLERDPDSLNRDEESRRERYIQSEYMFHGTILKASRNPTAAQIVENMRLLRDSQSFMPLMPVENEVANDRLGIEQHRAVLAALVKRDPGEAAEAMRRHVQSGRERFYARVQVSATR